jgi:hypothetical protein
MLDRLANRLPPHGLGDALVREMAARIYWRATTANWVGASAANAERLLDQDVIECGREHGHPKTDAVSMGFPGTRARESRRQPNWEARRRAGVGRGEPDLLPGLFAARVLSLAKPTGRSAPLNVGVSGSRKSRTSVEAFAPTLPMRPLGPHQPRGTWEGTLERCASRRLLDS